MQRLRGGTLCRVGAHIFSNGAAVAFRQHEGGLDDIKLFVAENAFAVTEAAFAAGKDTDLSARTDAHDALANVGDICAVSAAIHGKTAADRAGDPLRECKTRKPFIPCKAGKRRDQHPRTGADTVAKEAFCLPARNGTDHNTVKSAVGYERIGAVSKQCIRHIELRQNSEKFNGCLR